MEMVYLLVALAGAGAFALAIYVVIALLIKRVNKDKNSTIIKKAICNSNKDCALCNGNCEKFVDEVISRKRSVDDCPKISTDDKEEIKDLLGIKPVISNFAVAHVFCKGGARAVNQYGYVGPASCDYSNKLYDGLKMCQFGCQGCMDCAKVCPTGAIFKNSVGVAEVDRSLCVGCGECTKACPDGLIKLIGLDQEVALSCKQSQNQKTGAEIHNFCGVGCTKCGECVKVCPTGAMTEVNGLIKYNRSLCINCTKCVNVCPNSTISSIKNDFVKFQNFS